MSKGYTVRKKRGADAFKPNPRIHADPKSRRHFPITQASQFCIRRIKNGKLACKNARRCNLCFPAFELWEPINKEKRHGRRNQSVQS